MDMHEINIDILEQIICCDYVDELWMGGKPEKFNNLGHRNVYRTDLSEEDKEEVEGTVLCDGGEEVSLVPNVYTCGKGSISSLGSYLSVFSSSKPSFTLSLGACHIQEYFKKNWRRKRKFIKSHQEKARQEDEIKKNNVILQ